MKNIAILGGGISGLIAANHLAKQGYKVLVFEKTDRLGGLLKSTTIDGFTYDIGTFIFNSSYEIYKRFPELKKYFPEITMKKNFINADSEVIEFPFKISTYIKSRGVLKIIGSMFNILYNRMRYKGDYELSRYMRYYIGDDMFKFMGLKDYIQRLYDSSIEDVDKRFADQRVGIKNILTFKRVFNMLFGRFIRLGKNTQDKWLVRSENGFQELLDFLKKKNEELGVVNYLNTNITKISKIDNKFKLESAPVDCEFDTIISTIPLEEILALCGIKPQNEYSYVSLLSLYYKGDLKKDYQVLRNHDKTGMWKRLTIFSNLYGKKDNYDYFTVEITKQKIYDGLVEEAKEDFENHFRKFSEEDIKMEFVGHEITERAYPLYKKGFKDKMNEDLDKLSKLGIITIGRQGMYDFVSSNNAVLRTLNGISSV